MPALGAGGREFESRYPDGVLAHLARARHWQCRGERFESAILHILRTMDDVNPHRPLFLRGRENFQEKLFCRVISGFFGKISLLDKLFVNLSVKLTKLIFKT